MGGHQSVDRDGPGEGTSTPFSSDPPDAEVDEIGDVTELNQEDLASLHSLEEEGPLYRPDGLSPEQRESLHQLALLMEDKYEDAAERHFCSESCLVRYLRARNFNAKKAARMLCDTLKWRRKEKPWSLTVEDVMDAARTGKLYANGQDRAGRPVFYMRTGIDVDTEWRVKLNHIVYTLECMSFTLQEDMRDTPDNWIFLVDFKKQAKKKRFRWGDMRVAYNVVNILSNHFPDRVKNVVFFHASGGFRFLWKMISPFLSSETKKKFLFVRGEQEVQHALLSRLIDDEHLEEEYGGRLPYGFKFEEDFLPRMQELDRRRSELRQALLQSDPQ